MQLPTIKQPKTKVELPTGQKLIHPHTLSWIARSYRRETGGATRTADEREYARTQLAYIHYAAGSERAPKDDARTKKTAEAHPSSATWLLALTAALAAQT